MNKPKKRKTGFIISILVIAFAVCYLGFLTYLQDSEAHIMPDYPRTDIERILSKEEFCEEDYRILYLQTGLARPAVDALKETDADFKSAMLKFQENFFKDVRITSEKNTIISREEFVADENGNKISGTEMAPLQNGDILITKSSRTYGWRNGHAAIVVDEEKGIVLESAVLGTDSSPAHISKWTKYPNFMVFRLKGVSRELRNKIAASAMENLNSVPYSLTVGIFSPKFRKNREIKTTNCSHLVWSAYMLFGYDLDYDGGLIVTPKDIANSPLLEVVQVYGVNPENPWP